MIVMMIISFDAIHGAVTSKRGWSVGKVAPYYVTDANLGLLRENSVSLNADIFRIYCVMFDEQQKLLDDKRQKVRSMHAQLLNDNVINENIFFVYQFYAYYTEFCDIYKGFDVLKSDFQTFLYKNLEQQWNNTLRVGLKQLGYDTEGKNTTDKLPEQMPDFAEFLKKDAKELHAFIASYPSLGVIVNNFWLADTVNSRVLRYLHREQVDNRLKVRKHSLSLNNLQEKYVHPLPDLDIWLEVQEYLLTMEESFSQINIVIKKDDILSYIPVIEHLRQEILANKPTTIKDWESFRNLKKYTELLGQAEYKEKMYKALAANYNKLHEGKKQVSVQAVQNQDDNDDVLEDIKTIL